jgi:hypothetical protein
VVLSCLRKEANSRFWHEAEEALWSAHQAVSGPSFHPLFVSL